MVNTNELRAAIVRKGFKMQEVAYKIGISVPSLSDKMHCKRDFKASEIECLASLLNLSPNEIYSIFFQNMDEKMST